MIHKLQEQLVVFSIFSISSDPLFSFPEIFPWIFPTMKKTCQPWIKVTRSIILKIVLSEFCNFNSETIYFWKKMSLEFHRNWWNTPVTLINSNSNSNSNYFFQEIFNSNSRVENYFNSNSNSGVIGINYFNSPFHVELNPTLHDALSGVFKSWSKDILYYR